jgi:phage recombination protein Bet
MKDNEIVTQKIEETYEWLSEENKKIIMKQFFPPSTSAIEMQYCISVAKTFNLNPILKQIFFVPRKSNVNGQWVEKVEPLCGRDSFLTLAHRSKKFIGLESTSDIEETPKLDNGKWIIENDLVATATAWRKDCEKPFVVKVKYSEYVQKKKDGTPTKFWLEKPTTMLKKVAESQVLRKAFDITGLFAEEEIDTTPSQKEICNDTTLNLNNIVKEKIGASNEVKQEEKLEIDNQEIVTEVIAEDKDIVDLF